MRLLTTARRALRLVCFAAALCAPGVASAELPVPADFDGDGRSDTVTVDRTEPSVVRVWLSRTGTSAVLRSKRPLAGVMAADLDGDHRPELILRDVFSHLHIWKRDSKAQRFTLHAPKKPPQTTRRPASRSIGDGQSDPPEALQGARYTPDLIGCSAVSAYRISSHQLRTHVVATSLPPSPRLAFAFARPPPTQLA